MGEGREVVLMLHYLAHRKRSFSFLCKKGQLRVSKTATYWCAVFHHGIVHFVTFCNTAREEATLADVVVKVL